MAVHRAAPPPLTPEQATRDLLARMGNGGGFWIAVLVLGLLALAGLVRLYLMVMAGPEPRSKWGYAAAVLAFLLSTAHSAPILAFASRLAKGFWAVPARRAAELFTVSGLVTTPLFIVLINQLPDWPGRWSFWFFPNQLGVYPGAPYFWDSLAIAMLTVLGLAILYVTGLPDFAHARDQKRGFLAGPLSLGWKGTTRQWQVLSTGVILLGAFYLTLFVFVHMYMVTDLGMSLVPGWRSAVIPPYHAVSGLQAGAATTILAAAILRKVGGLERYMPMNVFWGAAKLLLGTSLLFFYFTWSELLLNWYGRLPEEQYVLSLLMFGPFLPLFVLSFLCNFILPWFLLIFNRVRVSINGPTLVAAIVLTGNFIDRVRIYVASWSVAGPVGQHLDAVPALRGPNLADLAIVVGALSAVGVLYLLATKLLPPISIWEYRNSMLLTVEREFIHTEVAVIAKPR